MHKAVLSLLDGPGTRLSIAMTGAEALALMERGQFDLVIIDISLPDCDGIELCSRLQALPNAKGTPFVFLTGQADISNKLAAFSLGAEDYIVKPFNPLEFRARIQAKLKRIGDGKTAQETLIKGSLTIDLIGQSAKLSEDGMTSPLELTPIEFRLLVCLARNEGRVMSRNQLIEAVWGQSVHVLDRTVDTHISCLRRKLGSAASFIKSVPRAGYQFTLEPAKAKAS